MWHLTTNISRDGIRWAVNQADDALGLAIKIELIDYQDHDRTALSDLMKRHLVGNGDNWLMPGYETWTVDLDKLKQSFTQISEEAWAKGKVSIVPGIAKSLTSHPRYRTTVTLYVFPDSVTATAVPTAPADLLQELVVQAEGLPQRDEVALDAFRRRAEMVLRNLFSSDSRYITDLYQIRFTFVSYTASASDYEHAWAEGKVKTINLLNTIVEEVKTFGVDAAMKSNECGANISKRVFIVHGRDDGPKQAVARFLTRIGLEPIILHEQASNGLTLIEKIENHTENVAYAVVILTPDDSGCLISESDKQEQRARQNVVLELGFFLGKLGRSKVCALHKEEVVLPSDINGVVYVKMDDSDGWQLGLFKEIEAAGLPVDRSKFP